MKILLIDNHTEHLEELVTALAGHQVEVQKYEPGLKFNETGKDLVILSGGGGEGREAHDVTKSGQLWYQDEIDFILKTKLPIFGICMGFELIAQAYGAKIEKMPGLIEGWHEVKQSGQKLRQFESHRFGIKKVPKKHFNILADSDTGVELIKHKTRPLFASQFHPEVPGGTLNMGNLLELGV